MIASRKTVFCWWPKRLARRLKGAESADHTEFVGWVWWQYANLTHNHYHGWVAWLDDGEPVPVYCKSCGRETKESERVRAKFRQSNAAQQPTEPK
ncbi:MAG: hypothetical protein ING61_11150 [Rhodocyclaceae bacterium]|nr:hypothetical protein [Rhodocyclaceae bacterium]